VAGKTFTTVTAALSGGPAGTTSLYLVFKGGTGNLFDVDAFTVDTGAPPAGASTLIRVAESSRYGPGRTACTCVPRTPARPRWSRTARPSEPGNGSA
jgi:hypothetical protein